MKEKIIAQFTAVVNEIHGSLEHKTMMGITFSLGVLAGYLLF